MKSRNILLLLVVAALGFVTYRSGAAGRNSCVATILFPQSEMRTIANEGEAGGDKEHPVAPAWELKDLEGKAVKLSDFKGKVVLLNFWATWCPPCREEIPDLVALQNQYRDQGLVVIGLSFDRAPAAVKSFATRNKINYPLVMADQETAVAYGNVEAIPTTFFIGRDGKVASAHAGGADKATLEAGIKPLFEKSETKL